MGTINYQERISECACRAATADNPQVRDIWKRMEEFWRKRAANALPATPLNLADFLARVRSTPEPMA